MKEQSGKLIKKIDEETMHNNKLRTVLKKCYLVQRSIAKCVAKVLDHSGCLYFRFLKKLLHSARVVNTLRECESSNVYARFQGVQ